MKIVDNCDFGIEYYVKGFKVFMLFLLFDIVNEFYLERWYVF